MSNCRNSLERPAPSANRIDISRPRLVALASNILAMLMQANAQDQTDNQEDERGRA